MILSDKDIIILLQEKKLLIEPKPAENEIECTHVNLHLDRTIKKYKEGILDLRDDSSFRWREIHLQDVGYDLKPGEFVLGSTIEKVTIPNGYFGFIETKGNIARAGIQAHNADGHLDPGFSGNVTLEIKNNANNTIRIYSGIAIVQMYLFKASSDSIRPYVGKYQYQRGPTIYLKD